MGRHRAGCGLFSRALEWSTWAQAAGSAGALRSPPKPAPARSTGGPAHVPCVGWLPGVAQQ